MGGTKARKGTDTSRQGAASRSGPAAAAPHRYDALLALQRTAGNRATASLLHGRVVQRCMGHTCPPSGCERSDAGAEPAALVQRVTSDGGRPLDPGVRTGMEAKLGHGFGAVRVHTDAAADASARALQADAYTLGEHVVFRGGRYAPDTTVGRRTLAHELTHVVQQSRHPVPAGPRTGGLGVSDPNDRFEREAARTAETVTAGGRPPAPRGRGPAAIGVVQRQQPSQATTPAARTVPRPAALPLNQGFQLYELSSLPAALADTVPEGQVATLALVAPVPATGSGAPRAAEALGVGAWRGLSAANAALTGYGLPGAAAGADAIGIVAIPRVNVGVNPLSPRFNFFDPAAPLDFWGHTAVYVRQGGRIVAVRGFNPQMAGLLSRAGGVEAGLAAVPSAVSPDAYLFTSNAARSVEYPVAAERVAQFLGELPDTGVGGRPGVPELYTARPATWAAGRQPTLAEPFCVGSNCGLWAIGQGEQALGGPIGRAGQGSVTAVGEAGATVPGTASQGRLIALLDEANAARAAGAASPLAEVPGATGAAVAGRVPTALRVLKVGGRVMLVVGVVAAGYELYTATPEQRPRTAVGIAGGFAGGSALGAGAGLLCGPGAPVCSIVAGLVLGTVGALGGRALFEGLYDELTRPTPYTGYPGHSIVCPSCHDNPAIRAATARMRSPFDPADSSRLFELFREVQGTGTAGRLTQAELAAIRAWLPAAE